MNASQQPYKDLDLHPGRPPQKDACSLTALDSPIYNSFHGPLHSHFLWILPSPPFSALLRPRPTSYQLPASEGFFASLLLFDLQPVETRVTNARNFNLQPGCPFSAGLCEQEEWSGTTFVRHRSQHMTTLAPLFSLHKQKMSEICQTAMTLSN